MSSKDCDYDYEYDLNTEYAEQYLYKNPEKTCEIHDKKRDSYEIFEGDAEEEIISTLSPSSSYSSTDTSYTSSVSTHNLEERAKYEIQWHIGSDIRPKTVAAKFDRKIYNYDPRYLLEFEECPELAEFDLVFQQLNTGNMFTIHSDLIDTGVVEFFPLHDRAVF